VHNLKKLTFGALYLVIGVAENKNIDSILEEIIPPADFVYATRFQIGGRKCTHPKDILSKSKKHLKKDAHIEMHLDPIKAYDQALKKAQNGDLILVTGSFYLAGELRGKWYSEEWVLEHRKSFV
jgi:folylpolyglutamate synthase/dihydropteroate synthase